MFDRSFLVSKGASASVSVGSGRARGCRAAFGFDKPVREEINPHFPAFCTVVPKRSKKTLCSCDQASSDLLNLPPPACGASSSVRRARIADRRLPAPTQDITEEAMGGSNRNLQEDPDLPAGFSFHPMGGWVLFGDVGSLSLRTPEVTSEARSSFWPAGHRSGGAADRRRAGPAQVPHATTRVRGSSGACGSPRLHLLRTSPTRQTCSRRLAGDAGARVHE